MYHYHYHPPLPPEYCGVIIGFCLLFLLICYQRKPFTYKGKRTVGGLLGLAVGIVVALGKMMFDAIMR